MKKSLTVFATMLTLLLCGCRAGENADNSDYGDIFLKAQEIAVISSDTSEVIETITDAEDIKNFTLALDADRWKLSSLPDNVSELGSFGLSQQKTIKVFDINPDETLYDVGTITLYDGGYIGIEIAGLAWSDVIFEVSEDTNDFLKGFFLLARAAYL